jgi:mannose-6-phosphate isomerase-like protein (cupin superfamily)
VAIYAQPRPGNPTTATVITKAEIDKISASEQSATTMDQNARVMDIGDGWSMEVGVIHRGKQKVMTVAEAAAARANAPAAGRGGNAPAAGGAAAAAGRGAAPAAPPTPCGEQMATPPPDALQGAITHDFQTEGYLIVSGSGVAFIDGRLINGRRGTNNPDGGPNGPGCGGGVALGSRKVELKVGDVLIVPPGVIHGWFDIPDHVDYLSFRPSHDVMKNGWVNPTIAPK